MVRLEGSDYLELHRLGIPHAHPGGSGTLGQPHILISLLTGIAHGLKHLSVDYSSVVCTSPVNTGAEYSSELTTQAIFDQYKIPYQPQTLSGELVTPDGAAILAALSPKYIATDDMSSEDKTIAYGLGGQSLDGAPSLAALLLAMTSKRKQLPGLKI